MKDNSKKARGSIEVYLPPEEVNALLSALNAIAVADPENRTARHAERLKQKILKHGRRFTDKGTESSVIYFYNEEAATLIHLFSFFTLVTQKPEMITDFFSQMGRSRRE